MTAYPLFDLIPAAHSADPATSHEAAGQHTRSGHRQRNVEIVVELVRRFPGCTAIELWDWAKPEERDRLKEPQEIRRRLTDALHLGRVRQGPARRCTIRETRMVTWETATNQHD